MENHLATAAFAGTSSSSPLDVTDEEISIAERVLASAAVDAAFFDSKRWRALRKRLLPLLQSQQARMFDGGDVGEYRDRKRRKLASAVQRNLDKQRDKEYVNKTQLRAARIAKLSMLAAQDGADSSVTLVPDGIGEESLVATGLQARLTDFNHNASAACGDDDGDSANETSDCEVHMNDASQAPSVDGSSSAPASSASAVTTMMIANDEVSCGSVAVSRRVLTGQRACYICKCRFRELHHFYDMLCPSCAELNWIKRNQTADLKGRVAIVTGARVKIGFHCALKLLRAGAEVIATTRFPVDAAERFALQPDYATFAGRLHVIGLDLRDLHAVESFCAGMLARRDRLDIIVNNACQTVRRPPAYFAATAAREAVARLSLPDSALRTLGWNDALHGYTPVARIIDGSSVREIAPLVGSVTDVADMSTSSLSSTQALVGTDATPILPRSSVMLSQLSVVPGDAYADSRLFPVGVVDVNAQQLDLRKRNSWLLRMDEVATPELAEVMLINAMSPFVLNSRLKPLLLRGRGDLPTPSLSHTPLRSFAEMKQDAAEISATGEAPASTSAQRGKRMPASSTVLGEKSSPIPQDVARFIVNVSAMEGKFYRAKLPTHPHTNMAKVRNWFRSALVLHTCRYALLLATRRCHS